MLQGPLTNHLMIRTWKSSFYIKKDLYHIDVILVKNLPSDFCDGRMKGWFHRSVGRKTYYLLYKGWFAKISPVKYLLWRCYFLPASNAHFGTVFLRSEKRKLYSKSKTKPSGRQTFLGSMSYSRKEVTCCLRAHRKQEHNKYQLRILCPGHNASRDHKHQQNLTSKEIKNSETQYTGHNQTSTAPNFG